MTTLIKQMLQLSQLVEIQRMFQEEKIPTIHLKGIIQYQYLDQTLPESSPQDIDILIKRQNFRRAVKVFKKAGYTMFLEHPFIQITVKEALTQPQINFVKYFSGHAIVFDIHLLLLNPTKHVFDTLPRRQINLLTAEVFGRAQPLIFNHTKFLLLENEDMLLHQCLNYFFHHCCRGINQLNDINNIIDSLPIRWDEVLARIQRWKLSLYIYYPLFLTQEIYQTEIPKNVLSTLKPKGVLSTFVKPWFINKRTANQPIGNPRIRYYFNILLRFFLLNNFPTNSVIKE